MSIIPVAAEGLTCTVRLGASGELCAKAATLAFITGRGERFAECAEHESPLPVAKPTLAVGARVGVLHGGITKIGTVVSVARTTAKVEIPVVRTGGTKVLTFPIASLTV